MKVVVEGLARLAVRIYCRCMQRTSAILSLLLITIAGCAKPEPAELAKSDAAFRGQAAGEAVVLPVASRIVMIGNDGASAPACAARARPRGASIAVHWSTDVAAPVKMQRDDEFFVCERDGDWAGIIFPATGFSMSSCATGNAVREPREYQGPCRWGWVKNSEMVRATS